MALNKRARGWGQGGPATGGGWFPWDCRWETFDSAVSLVVERFAVDAPPRPESDTEREEEIEGDEEGVRAQEGAKEEDTKRKRGR